MTPLPDNPPDAAGPPLDALPLDALPSTELSRCAACGYRLEGLPREGTCPECNARFDRGEIILLGRLAGPRGGMWWARPFGAFTIVFAGIAVAGIWGYAQSPAELSRLLIPAALIFFFLPAVWKQYRRTVAGRTHEIAVRMTSQGVGIATDPADARAIELTPWHRVTRLRLIPKRKARLWIWVRCDDVDLFDALVECPRNIVPELQQRIGRWFTP